TSLVPFTRAQSAGLFATWEPHIGEEADRTRTDTRITFGVADLAGNVAEWTETEYLPYPGSQARRDDGHRIIRGGGFRVPAREQTATERFFDRPSASYDFVGFRCAKDQAESGAGGAAQGKN
ncbi:MAG: formylglycine-generating enzyme family protein, partial [Acidobacteriota bacterium]